MAADDAIIDEYNLAEVNLILPLSHPLFLHPNDMPGMTLVSEVLDGRNYTQWSRSMHLHLLAKSKLGLVTGVHKCHSPNSKYFAAWNRCNDMIIGWILNSISAEIRSSIVYIKNAKDIWDDLAIRFTQGNAPQVFNLRKELTYLSQGSLTISAYYTKFRSLWDEIENLIAGVPCTCDAAVAHHEQQTLQKIIQFMMGLHEKHHHTRSSILAMNPLPSMMKVISILEHDESTTNTPLLLTPDISNALLTKTRTYPNKPQSRRIDNKASKALLKCEYCGGTGHLQDTCFFLKGFPDWHPLFGVPPNPAKMPKYQTTKANVITTQDSPIANAVLNSGLSSDQYKEILSTIDTSFTNTTMSEVQSGLYSQDPEGDWKVGG